MEIHSPIAKPNKVLKKALQEKSGGLWQIAQKPKSP
jgi:hypothetical protein